MATFTLPLLPTPVNQKYVNRRYVLSSKYRQSMADIKMLVPRNIKMYEYSVYLGVSFFISKDRDIDSSLKCLLDALTGVCYKDDKQIVELNVIKLKCLKGFERTVVTIGYTPAMRDSNVENPDLTSTDTHNILVSS